MTLNRRLTLAAAILLGFAGAAGAQVSSSLQSIALTAAKGQTVALGTPSPALQTVTLVDGQINTYATPFTITTSWDVLQSTTTTVKLVAYFTTPAQALANGTDYIPTSSIEISTDAGANWAPVTGNAVGGAGTAGGSLVLYTSPVTQGSGRTGSQLVTFQVRINLTSGPTTVAGSYTGTLNLMAICN